MKRRIRKPKIKFRGVFAHLGTSKTWKFRARVRRHGVDRYGTLRDSQEAAAEDYLALKRLAGTDDSVTPFTLEEAFEVITGQALARGIAESTIVKQYQSNHRFLLRYWRPNSAISDLTVKEVLWFVREATHDGSSPNTILGKYLPLIARIARVGKCVDPTPEVRELANIERVAVRKERLTIKEAYSFIERIRSETILTKNKRREITYPARDRHADIATVILFTGGRASEIGNLTLSCIEGDVLRLEGKTAKSGANYAAIHSVVRGPIDRLAAHARKAGRKKLFPGGMNYVVRELGRWGKRLDVRVNGRILRHTIAFGLLDTPEVTLADVQSQLGHKKATTTNEYTYQSDAAALGPISRLIEHNGIPLEPDAPNGEL